MVEVESGCYGQRPHSSEGVTEAVLDTVEDCLRAEDQRIGDCFLGTITSLKEPPSYLCETGISIFVQTPSGEVEFGPFDRPFAWDAETNPLVELAEAFGYDKTNWHNLQGETVIVRPHDNPDVREAWALVFITPAQIRADLQNETNDKTTDTDSEITTNEGETLDEHASNEVDTPDKENVEETDKEVSYKRDAETVLEECLMFNSESIGDYLPRKITRIYEGDIEADESLIVEVETPDGNKKWFFELPHQWNTKNPFVHLAESHGFGPANWTHLEDETVLVRPKDTGSHDSWMLNTTPPDEHKRTLSKFEESYDEESENDSPQPIKSGDKDTQNAEKFVLIAFSAIVALMGSISAIAGFLLF